MHFIVDANVFAGYFRQQTGRLGEALTCDPCDLFDLEDGKKKIVFDATRHIQSEWERTTSHEWATAWIGNALISGKIEHHRPISEVALTKLLQKFGFPLRNSKDVWYLRTADALRALRLEFGFVTEDLDFFDPTLKGQITGADRLKFLREGNAKLKTALARRGIAVGSVHCWCGA